MKKKVLYIVPGFSPSNKDGVYNRVVSFVKHFKLHGYEIVVVALPHFRDYLHQNKQLIKTELGVECIIIPHKFNLDNKYKNIYAFFEKIFILFLVLFYKCNLILADYSIGAILSQYAKRFAKLIVNHRGDGIDELKAIVGCDDNDPRVVNLKYYLKKAVELADYNICVSHRLVQQIQDYVGKNLQNVFIFPCCADKIRFTDLCAPNNDRIVVGYFGGLNVWQCFEHIIDMFKRLIEKDHRFFLLVLTNSDYSQYKNELDSIGASNYEVKKVHRDDMPKEISRMDISIAIREDRPLNRVSSPTKLCESLLAGVPTIVTRASGDYSDFITHGSNGFITNEVVLSEEELNDLWSYCIDVKNNRKYFFEKCRKSVENRTWNLYSDKLNEFIK